MKKVRLLIAEEQLLVAGMLKQFLEPEYEVIKIVSDGGELLRAGLELKPDIVLLDVVLPILSGIEVGQQLKEHFPSMKFVVLTSNDDLALASRALSQMANGYVLKSSPIHELKRAISAAMLGQRYTTPAIARRLVTNLVNAIPEPSGNVAITPRQREVLRLLARGQSMKQAAAILNITARTIAFHKYAMMSRQGLKTNSELLHFAFRQKLVGEAA